MTDFASIINGITQATQVVGAVNGAVNTLAPALQNIEMSVNNVAGSVNGMMGYNRPDMYAPQQMYYAPQGSVPTSMSRPDESSGIGTIGSALAGGAIGAMMGPKTAAAIKPPSNPQIMTEGIGSKINISPTAKSTALTAAKAGGIGAAVGGLFSGVENFMKLSRNEITGAEATGNIVADSTVGFFSGAGALATGTMASMALGGLATMPGMIGAGVAGLVGAVGIDFLMRKTGIRQAISDGVRKILG